MSGSDVEPADHNFGGVVRGQPESFTFDFYTDAAETVPYDLEAVTPTMVVGGLSLAVGSGIVLSVGGDGTGTVKNRATVTLTGAQTLAFSAPSSHWYFSILNVGVPVRGEMFFVNP